MGVRACVLACMRACERDQQDKHAWVSLPLLCGSRLLALSSPRASAGKHSATHRKHMHACTHARTSANFKHHHNIKPLCIPSLGAQNPTQLARACDIPRR